MSQKKATRPSKRSPLTLVNHMRQYQLAHSFLNFNCFDNFQIQLTAQGSKGTSPVTSKARLDAANTEEQRKKWLKTVEEQQNGSAEFKMYKLFSK